VRPAIYLPGRKADPAPTRRGTKMDHFGQMINVFKPLCSIYRAITVRDTPKIRTEMLPIPVNMMVIRQSARGVTPAFFAASQREIAKRQPTSGIADLEHYLSWHQSLLPRSDSQKVKSLDSDTTADTNSEISSKYHYLPNSQYRSNRKPGSLSNSTRAISLSDLMYDMV
jgi:hypothetical protein